MRIFCKMRIIFTAIFQELSSLERKLLVVMQNFVILKYQKIDFMILITTYHKQRVRIVFQIYKHTEFYKVSYIT